MTLELARPTFEQERVAERAFALAHLLACLDSAVRALDDVGQDVDARIVEAHVAQLRRGHEWPGDSITPPVLP